MVDQAQDRNPVEIWGEEFLDRRRAGEPATVKEYVNAHPEFETEIRRVFRAMIAMEQFKSCTLSSSQPAIDIRIESLEQLGDFRIIGELGRGGMGVVYEAEQQSLGRRVAVKVFPEMALKDLRQLDRFHREARTAASLHHTNIVPVFGVGEQDGLHYYVMQRIEGIALDTAINDISKSRLRSSSHGERNVQSTASTSTSAGRARTTDTTPQVRPQADRGTSELTPPRITDLDVEQIRDDRSRCRWVANVGIQIAEAVAFAHAQGVLHRDIKPGNLLLDPQGIVWITDFGLATVLQAGRQSRPDDVAGTLRFMAPEHLSGEQDTRSDIYSLGVTLYELLTLRPAFEGTGRARLIDKILKGEFVAPRESCSSIPLDLEAIVLKAMALEPKRRYQDAETFAADLRRFVAGRPVRARPIGKLGQFWRWTRRNPAIASLSAALLLVVLSSFVLISSKWQEAVAENRRAEDNLTLALESMDQILGRYASSWMAHPAATADQDGAATTSDIEFQMAISDHSAIVLQDALKFYDRFAKQNTTTPQLQRDTAKVHRRVADIYQRLGQYGKAEQAYRRSLEILGAEPVGDNATLALQRARTLNQLGVTMYAISRFEEAEVEFRRADSILSNVSLQDDPKCQAELARTSNNLGETLWLLGRRGPAKRSHQQAVERLEILVREYPDDADYRLALARAYRIYYPFVAYGGRGQEDRNRIRTAGIAILEAMVSSYPNVPDYQYELSEMLTTTSGHTLGMRSNTQQIQQLERAASLARELSQAYPTVPRYRALLARTLKELARIQRGLDRDLADQLYNESITIDRLLTQEFADIPAYHIFLAMTLREYAEQLRRVGRLSESRMIASEGLEAQQAYVTLRPENEFGKFMLASLHDELAKTLTALEAGEQAEQARQQARRLRNQ